MLPHVYNHTQKLSLPAVRREFGFCTRHPFGNKQCKSCLQQRRLKRSFSTATKKLINNSPKTRICLTTGLNVQYLKQLYSLQDIHDGLISYPMLVKLLQDAGLSEKLAIQHSTGFFRLCHARPSTDVVRFSEFIDDYIRMELFTVMRAVQTGTLSKKSIDLDGDGEISLYEMKKLLTDQLGAQVAQDMALDLFLKMDLDHSGKVSFAELCEWYVLMNNSIVAKRRHKHEDTKKKKQRITRGSAGYHRRLPSELKLTLDPHKHLPSTSNVHNACGKHLPDFDPSCQACKVIHEQWYEAGYALYHSLPNTDVQRKYCVLHFRGNHHHTTEKECKDCVRSLHKWREIQWNLLDEYSPGRQYCPQHFQHPSSSSSDTECPECKHASLLYHVNQEEKLREKQKQEADQIIMQSLAKQLIAYRVDLFNMFNGLDVGRTGFLNQKQFTNAVMRVLANEDPSLKITKQQVESLFKRHAGVDKHLEYVEFLQHFKIIISTQHDHDDFKKQKKKGSFRDLHRLQGLFYALLEGYQGKGFLKTLFDTIDTNNDGYITKKEMKAALSRALRDEVILARREKRPIAHWAQVAGPLPELGIRLEDVDKLFEYMDYNQIGKISLTKFTKALKFTASLEEAEANIRKEAEEEERKRSIETKYRRLRKSNSAALPRIKK